ncbi:hypothetical protein DMH27_13455 [Raoultella planticola]|nr:hypothetical protein [Raoultella planticola]
MTSPKRRRMNCNITRILYSDAPPVTGRLYCSQCQFPLPRREREHTVYYSTETLSKWCLPNGSTT